MKITQAQAHKAAQLLFPEHYATDRIDAVLRALEWLQEPQPQAEPKPEPAPIALKIENGTRKAETRALMKRLSNHMKTKGMSVNELGAELDVNPATLRTWLLGSYVPRAENLDKILKYLT
jgi:ribosome-binding protein aMBF1 (putative translation factor)